MITLTVMRIPFQGCGIVTMGSHSAAAAAIQSLNRQYTWENMDCPMVVEWMDASMQRRRKGQHLAHLPAQGQGPQSTATSTLTGSPAAGSIQGGSTYAASSSATAFDTDSPPLGCAPDAFKLFVGNLPRHCNEQRLLRLFEPIGHVVELVVVQDRSNQASMQPQVSAFVWYASAASAHSAIQCFHQRHCLPDPSGEQTRPLVVRRAKTRASPTGPGGVAGAVGGARSSETADWQLMQLMQTHLQDSGGLHFPSPPPNLMLQQLDGQPPSGASRNSSLGQQHPSTFTLEPFSPAQLLGMLATANATNSSEGCWLETLLPCEPALPGAQRTPDGSYGLPGPRLDTEQFVMLPLSINQQQMLMLQQHLSTLRALTGTQLSVISTAPGRFQVVISGTATDIQMTETFLHTLLNSSQPGHLTY